MDTPTFQNATENKDATIRCEVKGNPDPTVTWYHNGVQIICEYKNFFNNNIFFPVYLSDMR